MAKYIVEGCSDGLEYIVSASTVLSPLQVIDFNFGEDTPICGTVISETELEPIPLYTYLDSYTDCLSCVQENNFSFYAIDCNFPISGEVSSLYFNEFPVGKFYKFCLSDPENPEITTCFCLEILGISPDFTEPIPDVVITGPFNSCGCESPRSAGTEYNVCVICCDCGASGSTVTQVVPPHPVWTDGYGTPVTQINMVTLGGMFGLNR
jgi:hypothetical protein